jgi:ribonuclease HIII
MNSTLTGDFRLERLWEIESILAPVAEREKPNENIVLRLRGTGWMALFYGTGRLVIQGRDTSVPQRLLESVVSFESVDRNRSSKTASWHSLTNMVLPRIGSDESGKGDYFGPLVTAAVLVTEANQLVFEEEGVKDSKQLNSTAVSRLAQLIRNSAIHNVVTIGAQKYNELHARMGSVNRVLGWAHARALENVLEQGSAGLAVADQFGDPKLIEHSLMDRGKRIKLRQMPHGEADIAVAAASIIARSEFVRRMSQLSEDAGVELPLGASDRVIRAAITVANKHGVDYLRRVTKWHFATSEKVLTAMR